jgi:hypothetical protein
MCRHTERHDTITVPNSIPVPNLPIYRSGRASHRLILSLIIGDFLVCLLCVIKAAPQIAPMYSLMFDVHSCPQIIVDHGRVSVTLHNIFILTALSVDLCMAIRYPNKHRHRFSVKCAMTFICVVWTISLLLGYSSFFVVFVHDVPSNPMCMGQNHTDTSVCFKVSCSEYDTELLVVGGMCLSVVVHIVLYSIILVTLSAMRRQPAARSTLVQRRYRKAFISLCIMFASFCICFLPYSLSKTMWMTVIVMVDHVSFKHAIVATSYYSFGFLCLSALVNSAMFARRLPTVRRNWAYKTVSRAAHYVSLLFSQRYTSVHSRTTSAITTV